MSATIDRPARAALAAGKPPQFAQRLRTSFAAARVSFTWLGVRKSLSAHQKAQAAEGFGAEGAFLSAGKKLIDTRHPAFRAVTALRTRIAGYWRGLSLPYPEPGLRLIRQQDVEPFDARMRQFKAELDLAVAELEVQFAELKAVARDRLGRLYDERDYPASLAGLFDVAWDFPSVQPPEYLLRLNPALYEQEQARMTARFEQAVRLAEEAFASEFSELVTHLVERLSGSDDGKPRVFRDSAVGNLSEFFQRFRTLNVRSNEQLDELVETAQRVVKGIAPQDLRASDALRQGVRTQLSAVAATLDGMLVDQPRRRILRGKGPAGEQGAS
jgi:hypothetical protein